MADELFREPDAQSGPAILNREPILFPEQRKDLTRRVRRMMDR